MLRLCMLVSDHETKLTIPHFHSYLKNVCLKDYSIGGNSGLNSDLDHVTQLSGTENAV